MKTKKKRQSKDSSVAAKPPISIKRFAITYITLMGTFFALISFTPLQKIIDINGIYSTLIAYISTRMLHVTGLPCTSQGTLINLPSVSLDVVFGCNGLDAAMIYAIAVIVYPAQWKKKIAGIAAGSAALQIVNILRIVILAHLVNSGIQLKSYFEYIHLYVAQGLMIAISLGIFFLYLGYAKSPQTVHQ
jgi:exosortase/archaeosortase family protein